MLGFSFDMVHWPAVLVATVASAFLGSVWYSRVLFGPAWMGALGKSREQLPAPTFPFLVGILSTLVMAMAMDLLIAAVGRDNALSGAMAGLFFCLAFVATTMLSHYLYEGGRRRIFYIDVWYRVVSFTLMGAILGGWR